MTVAGQAARACGAVSAASRARALASPAVPEPEPQPATAAVAASRLLARIAKAEVPAGEGIARHPKRPLSGDRGQEATNTLAEWGSSANLRLPTHGDARLVARHGPRPRTRPRRGARAEPTGRTSPVAARDRAVHARRARAGGCAERRDRSRHHAGSRREPSPGTARSNADGARRARAGHRAARARARGDRRPALGGAAERGREALRRLVAGADRDPLDRRLLSDLRRRPGNLHRQLAAARLDPSPGVGLLDRSRHLQGPELRPLLRRADAVQRHQRAAEHVAARERLLPLWPPAGGV